MGVTIEYKGDTIATMNASGSKTLKTSGKYCEGDIDIVYQESVAPTVPCKRFHVTVDSDKTAKTVLTSADSDIAAHRNDSTFFVAVIPLFEYSSGLSFRGGFNTSHLICGTTSDPLYGYLGRTTASGANSTGFITKAATASSTDIGVTAAGEVFIYATTTIVLRQGSYLVVCGW